jgi:hypothetical protein
MKKRVKIRKMLLKTGARFTQSMRRRRMMRKANKKKQTD